MGPLTDWLGGSKFVQHQHRANIRESILLSKTYALVAVDGEGRVVGYMSYSIPRDASGSPQSHLQRLETALLGLQRGASDFLTSLTKWTAAATQTPADRQYLSRRKHFGDLLERYRLLNMGPDHQLSDNEHKGERRPYVYIILLVISPHHQGTGAGGALMAEALRVADERDMDAYLESSSAGYEFYKRRGFVDMQKDVVIVCPDDGVVIETLPTMLRRARYTL